MVSASSRPKVRTRTFTLASVQGEPASIKDATSALGQTGLMVAKITDRAPFVGYAENEEQTERKRLRNVLKKGDVYFNSGDLMRIDEHNFIYFQDRVGDTFRYCASRPRRMMLTLNLEFCVNHNFTFY